MRAFAAQHCESCAFGIEAGAGRDFIYPDRYAGISFLRVGIDEEEGSTQLRMEFKPGELFARVQVLGILTRRPKESQDHLFSPRTACLYLSFATFLPLSPHES